MTSNKRRAISDKRWSRVAGRLAFCLLLAALLLVPGMALGQSSAGPNDPGFREQWGLRTVGALCAWGHTTGSPSVIVAVVDSGVDMRHPDLVDRLRPGRDFVDGDNDPSDENGHGTNVAGIIAATINNGEGIVGLAPGVTILPVRVMNAEGYGSERVIAQGIRYAADQGARVINLSLGATLMLGDHGSELARSAIRYAQERGALVVVAAGNDFVPLPNAIVGDNPDVLVVAATDESDRKAPFSNSGPWISVTAPGVHILSTMPTYEVYLTSGRVPDQERFQQNYDYMSGTSQATPFVSGLAALLLSANPDWNTQQVAQGIREHAADISAQNQQLWERGYLGSGRIDACASLGGELAQQPAPTGAAPNSSAGSSNVLLVLGGLVCLTVVVLGVLATGVRRIISRPAPAAVGPIPVPPAQRAAGVWGGLTVVSGPAPGRSYPLAGAEILIGRAPECAVLLVGDATISRRHALVRNDGAQVTIEDLGSTHGTYLHGQPLRGRAQVRRGDMVQLGQTVLRFE